MTKPTIKKAILNDDRSLMDYIEKHLYSAVLSDIMDELGLTGYVMNERLRPLSDDCMMAGRARTVLWVDVFELHDNPYELELKAMDDLKPGDISVQYTGCSKRNAPWGELMSTAAKMRGAKGAIIDGLVRDVSRIKAMSFPVFCAGIKPLDSKGRGMVVDYDVPIHCGDVLVCSGDLVVADQDGIVVIPKRHEKDVILKAMEKVEKENHSRKELLEGLYLQQVYEKYKVL